MHPNGRRFMRGTMDKTQEEKDRAAAPDRRELTLIRTRTCALTNEPLTNGHVVADELGNLFNKEALFTALMDKSLPVEFSHIRGVKDAVTCDFFQNPSMPSASAGGGAGGGGGGWGTEDASPYACPITQLEMNGRNQFVVLRSTGKVLADKALRELGEAALQEEYGPFTADDVVRLVPSDEERSVLVARMQARRDREAQRKRDKQARKDKRKRERQGASAAADPASAPDARAAEDTASTDPAPALPKGKKAKVRSSDSSHASRAKAIMKEVQKAEDQAAGASTYSSLFHDDKAQADDANAQFIRRGGMRYTLM